MPRMFSTSLIRLLPLVFIPSFASAQQATLGPTLTQIITSGDGVARSCLQSEYSTGLGALFEIPVLTKWTTVQAAGRAYWISRGAECVDGFPPPDGTYIQEDRVNLLSRSFITTDIRLAARLAENAVSLAVGGGNAWHEGYDLPYLVFATGVSILQRPTFQLGARGELQWLRVSGDRFRRTYENFALVAEEPLGRSHKWSHALVLGIELAVPLGR
jgi:hypothetical protein